MFPTQKFSELEFGFPREISYIFGWNLFGIFLLLRKLLKSFYLSVLIRVHPRPNQSFVFRSFSNIKSVLLTFKLFKFC